MGTFHDDKGELHGRTVVVDTKGPRVLVGQDHEETPAGLILLHADEHEDGRDGLGKREFVARAAAVGPWPRQRRVVVPAADIASVRPL
jgi:hypothetical protein